MESLGDDAMVTSVAEAARARNARVEIDVLTGRSAASQRALANGLNPVEIWESPHFVRDLDALLTERNYDAVGALGADVMDGNYDLLGPAKTIAAVDLSARRGIPSSVLGFSFNARPRTRLAALYDGASREVHFQLRDQISYDRFTEFTRATADLVADCSFVLTAAGVPDDLAAWIEEMRAEGRNVVGINAHPMLFRDASAEQIEAIVQRVTEAILACSQTARVAWLLLPHDYRERVDAVCLEPIGGRIQGRLDRTVWYLAGRNRAATLKAVAGRLDGVVSGRMHLAIAALGMGVPALGLTSGHTQGKFEGLLQHYGLPSWLSLSPETYLLEGVLRDALARFINELPELRDTIESRRELVLGLSRRNFEIFDAVYRRPEPA
jgi:polysaccharide pyruvyl transferase WcaK-like protein